MALPASVGVLERELRGVFGSRLQSLVAYGLRTHHGAHAPVRTLALVESLSEQDLRACAGKVNAWHGAGLATPLLLASADFARSLDAFPLEFGAIIADHEVVAGTQPFAQAKVDPTDVRRACEVQARSHLLHLREAYLETHGRADALSDLIVQSAPAFAALLRSVARLEGQPSEDGAAARHAERTLGVPGGAVTDIVALTGGHELPSADAERLFAPYLDAVEKLVSYVDGWANR